MTRALKLPFRDKVSMFLRSFAVQGAWNYPRMQGLGFFFMVAPWLRKVKEGSSQAACRRHLGYFNTHPFLAGYVAGVVAKMEQEGKGRESVRTRDGLMGPLGALGDGFFWARVRPAAVLIALSVSFLWPWASAPALLLAFNVFHLKERWSGISAGFNRSEEPLGGIPSRGRKVISDLSGRLVLPACGFILGAAAMRSGAAWFILALFGLGILLAGRKFKTWSVLGCLLAAAFFFGLLGAGMRLPWSM